jgi:type II secretory pathway pseudopilin PulG
MFRSNACDTKRLGFSLLEVVCALATLGLVLGFLFQGLNQVEGTGDLLKKQNRILAARDVLRMALKLQNPDSLAEKMLHPGPLFCVFFKEDEPELRPCEGPAYEVKNGDIPDFLVYGRTLDARPIGNAVYLSLHPVSFRGLSGEAAYSFPVCF